jgi:hypothetical protein
VGADSIRETFAVEIVRDRDRSYPLNSPITDEIDAGAQNDVHVIRRQHRGSLVCL